MHSFTYDATGRLLTDVEPDGSGTTLDRTIDTGTGTETVAATDAAGHATTYTTEPGPGGGEVHTTTAPSGATTTVTTAADGSVTETEPDGTVATAVTGPDPRFGGAVPLQAVVTVTRPSGATSTVVRERAATLATPGQPLAVVTLSERDTTTASAAAPGGDPVVSIASTAYDAASRTLTSTSAAGRTTTTTFDAAGRAVGVRRGSGALIATAYDDAGRVTSHGAPGEATAYGYDASGDLATSTDPLGNVTRYSHDAAGELTGYAPPGSATPYTLSYDARGLLHTVTTPTGGVLHQSVDADGRDTGYAVGGLAGLVKSWDPAGNLATETTPAGQQLTDAVSAADLRTGETTAAATVGVAYTPAGTVASTTRTPASGAPGSAQTVAETDDGGLATGIAYSGAAAGSYAYGYDGDGVLGDVTLTSGGDTLDAERTVDADGLVTAEDTLTLARDDAGRTSSVALGGLTDVLTRDTQGRVTEADTTTGDGSVISAAAMSVSRDAAGETSAVTVGGVTTTYARDPAGRLTGATSGGHTDSYGYDADGRPTQLAGTALAYDSDGRLTTAAGAPVGTDAGGRITSLAGTTYTYDAAGELLTAASGGTAVAYSYDALRRRTAATVAGTTTQYLYGDPDDPLRVTASRSAAGVLSSYDYDGAGTLVGVRRGAQHWLVATDQVGSPVAVIAADGTVALSRRYTPYGTVAATSGSFDLPIGFAGGVTDPTTGEVRMGFRDYAPTIGRFTTPDPARLGGGLDLEGYADDDPVTLQDPTGLKAAPVINDPGTPNSDGADLPSGLGAVVSAYDGVGVTAEVHVSRKGISGCVGGGIGAGGGVSFSDSAPQSHTGLYTTGSIKVDVGVAKGGLGFSVDPCGTSSTSPSGSLTDGEAGLSATVNLTGKLCVSSLDL